MEKNFTKLFRLMLNRLVMYTEQEAKAEHKSDKELMGAKQQAILEVLMEWSNEN